MLVVAQIRSRQSAAQNALQIGLVPRFRKTMALQFAKGFNEESSASDGPVERLMLPLSPVRFRGVSIHRCRARNLLTACARHGGDLRNVPHHFSSASFEILERGVQAIETKTLVKTLIIETSGK